jgi:hypothetical protein
MARFAANRAEWPLAYDWMVAAFSLVDSDSFAQTLVDSLFEVHTSNLGGGFTSWADFFAHPPEFFDARLFCLTAIQILSVCAARLPPAAENAFFALMHKSVPDICSQLSVSQSASVLDNIQACKKLLPELETRLRPVTEAVNAADIHAFCNYMHAALGALNQKLVAAFLASYLPRGFIKTNVPHLFSSLQDLRSGSAVTIAELSRSCLALIEHARAELERYGTFAARCYLIPLFSAAGRIARDFYDKSDAIKPAAVRIVPHKRKYPFCEVGNLTRLAFVADNLGPGAAFDVEFAFLFQADLKPTEALYHIRILEKGRETVEIPVTVGAIPENRVEYYGEVRWRDFDGSSREEHLEGFLEGQLPNVDWAALRAKSPYSTNAVDEEKGTQFIGRQADLDRLVRLTATRDMGSAIIYGQKRVGKTSLANELRRVLRQNPDPHRIHSIYLEMGDCVEPTAEGTVRRLGNTLCERLSRIDAFSAIPLPVFTDSLAPLADYIDRALKCDQRAAVLVILDEFDELPLDLYKRGPVGDAFFLTLRSLTGRARVSVILVGAERIRPILTAQGDKLNKWVPVQLDYFNRQTDWTDFCELVTLPTKGQLEFSDDAVDKLYYWCEGNPYFCNVICSHVVELAIARRNSFITELEVEEAARKAVQVAGANSFQHFWLDGILAPGNVVEETSMRRRRVLIALANQLHRTGKPSVEQLRKEGILAPLSPGALDGEIKQFVERGVLTNRNDVIECRIKFFQEWLRDRGPQEISVQYLDPDQREQEERDEQEAQVTSSELIQLVNDWRVYRGKSVDAERIRAWLEQFGTNRNQRLMYQLLRKIRFYSQDVIRAKLSEAMGIVRRATVERKLSHGKFRRDLLVVGLGGLAKSGPKMARLFAQENRIIADNVLELTGLEKRVQDQRRDIQAIVIVDDFIGTGGTTADQLASVNAAAGEMVRGGQLKVIYIAVCGFEIGREFAESKAQELSLPVEIRLCDTLDEAHASNNVVTGPRGGL